MNSLTISEILRYTSNLSVIVPLIIYLRKIGGASREVHIIGALTIVSSLFDLVGFILVSKRIPTAVLSNTYFLVSFGLLSWFYFQILFRKAYRTLFLIGTGFYVGSFLFITFYLQSFSQNQSLLWSMTGIVFIIYGIAYFQKLMATVPITNYPDYSSIVINSGVLFYFAFNFFLFVASNYVLTQLDTDTARLAWSFHNVNNIIKNILFASGIYMYKVK